MKRLAWLLLVALPAGPGCVSPGTGFFSSKQVPALPPAPPPIVTATQITDENAAETIEAFSTELDYAERENQSPPASPAAKQ